jgi:hypothetical protein
MNCAELASHLKATLLHERNLRWVREAHDHAKQCQSCAQLLDLHLIEQQLVELSPIEPDRHSLENVMVRISKLEPVAKASTTRMGSDVSTCLLLLVGAVSLVAAYIGQIDDTRWWSELLPNVEFVRAVQISTFFNQESLLSMFLYSVGAFLLVIGFSLPELQVSRERVS